MALETKEHGKSPLVLLTRLAVVGLLIFVGCRSAALIPDQNKPWGGIDLDDPIGWFSDTKLSQLRRHPDQCIAALTASALEFERIDDRKTGDFCGFENAVAIERSVTSYSAPVRVSCPLAAALLVWEREILQPAAQARFGQSVARIEHVGTYSCRNVNGARSGRPSQHATANAIDIIGFRLEDGTLIRVQDSWRPEGASGSTSTTQDTVSSRGTASAGTASAGPSSTGPSSTGPSSTGNASSSGASQSARGEFLLDLRDGACRVFTGVLGPDYNRLHADHFHLDLGPYSLCS